MEELQKQLQIGMNVSALNLSTIRTAIKTSFSIANSGYSEVAQLYNLNA